MKAPLSSDLRPRGAQGSAEGGSPPPHSWLYLCTGLIKGPTRAPAGSSRPQPSREGFPGERLIAAERDRFWRSGERSCGAFICKAGPLQRAPRAPVAGGRGGQRLLNARWAARPERGLRVPAASLELPFPLQPPLPGRTFPAASPNPPPPPRSALHRPGERPPAPLPPTPRLARPRAGRRGRGAGAAPAERRHKRDPERPARRRNTELGVVETGGGTRPGAEGQRAAGRAAGGGGRRAERAAEPPGAGSPCGAGPRPAGTEVGAAGRVGGSFLGLAGREERGGREGGEAAGCSEVMSRKKKKKGW